MKLISRQATVEHAAIPRNRANPRNNVKCILNVVTNLLYRSHAKIGHYLDTSIGVLGFIGLYINLIFVNE